MDAVQRDSVAQAYGEAFGNFDEIFNHSIMFEPKFISMLQEAVKTGKILTREAIEKVFGSVPWEE